MKKKIAIILGTTLSLTLSLCLVALASNFSNVVATKHYPTYQFNFNNENHLDSGSGYKTFKTNDGNDINYSYSGVSTKENCFAVLDSSSAYFKNITQISGLASLDYVISSGSFTVEYGWSEDVYENSSSPLSGSGTFLFNQEYPSFFKIKCDSKVEITSLLIKYSCEEAINSYKDLNAPANPNPEHVYHEKIYADFPNYTDADATPGLTYTLSDDGTYYIVDNGREEMDCSGTDNLIIFPNEHNGLPVKEIHHNGFWYRWWIFGLYIPSNIEIIENECFAQTGLTKLYWNARNSNDFAPRNGIFSIDDHDHQNIDLMFGPDVEHIPERMLYPNAMNPSDLPRVNSVSFAETTKLKSIGDYAFYGQENISTLYLPDSIESIGDYAFYSVGATELVLPASLKTIGKFSFMFNDIQYIKALSNLVSMGEGAFHYSCSLVELDLSATKLTAIPVNAFTYASSLVYLKLPNGLLSIEEQAFMDSESLLAISLPDSIVSIGSEAFKGCEAATYIYLGRNLKDLGMSAFEGAVNVNKLVVQSEALNDLVSNNKVFLNLGKEVNNLLVFFRYGVRVIPSNFFHPSALKERLPNIDLLVLPTSLEEVHEYVFLNIDINIIEYYGSMSGFNSVEIDTGNNGLDEVNVRGI